MTLFAMGLFVFAILLSAFCSGTETGFFRSSRVRWVLDGIEGDWVSQRMLWLINNPPLYVGTSLIGNNIANYLISLSVVLLTQAMGQASAVELIAAIFVTPFVFVYSELLPKTLFFLAPNRLLRKCGWAYLVLFLLCSPLVWLLWGLGRIIELLVGQSPEKVRLILARKELEKVLQEGQEAGLLQPIQRRVAQNFFSVAAIPVGQVCHPISRVHTLQTGASVRQALAYAQWYRIPQLVFHGAKRTEFVGYVRTSDLLLAANDSATITEFRPLPTLKAHEHAGEAMLRMQTQRQELAQVVNEKNQVLGVISLNDLMAPLLEPAPG
jgi:CBS domain containing-hemolysin-like protein